MPLTKMRAAPRLLTANSTHLLSVIPDMPTIPPPPGKTRGNKDPSSAVDTPVSGREAPDTDGICLRMTF